MDDHTPPSDNLLENAILSEDVEMTEEILQLAAIEFDKAAAAFWEAGHIHANLAASINAQTARINEAADKLRKTLGQHVVTRA